MATARVLPRLDGRLGVAVRTIYLLLAAITIVIVGGSLIFNGLDYFRNMPAAARWGLRTFSALEAGAPPYIGHVEAEARAAGVREGDIMLAIQGRAMPRGFTEYVIGERLDAIAGDRLSVTTRRTDGTIATHVVPRLAGAWRRRDWTSGLPLWLSSVGSFLSLELIPVFLLAASLLLFARRPKDPEAMLFAIGFLLLCNVPQVGFWLLAILDIPVRYPIMLLSAGQCVIVIAAAGFPEGRFDTPWSKLVLLAAVPLTIVSTILRESAAVPATANLISTASLLLLSGIAMLGLTRRYRQMGSVSARQQVKWAVLGFCVSAIASVVFMWQLETDTTLPGNIPYYVFVQIIQALAFLALPLGLLVSLLRYRLYDAEATISRSAGYALLTLSIVVVFAASEKLIEVLGTNMLGGNVGAIAGGVSAGVAAVLVAPMHHRIDHWARHRFQRALVRLREGVPILVGDLREVATLDQLARAVLARVAEGVRARHLALVVDGRVIASRDVGAEDVAAWLRSHPAGIASLSEAARADAVFPVRLALRIEEETPVGLLLLGTRPDGSFYGIDEIEALREIADPVSRAIVICRQREAADLTAAARFSALSSKVERIEHALQRQGLL